MIVDIIPYKFQQYHQHVKQMLVRVLLYMYTTLVLTSMKCVACLAHISAYYCNTGNFHEVQLLWIGDLHHL